MKEWYDHKFCLKHCDSIKHCDYIVGTFGEILYSLFEKKRFTSLLSFYLSDKSNSLQKDLHIQPKVKNK